MSVERVAMTPRCAECDAVWLPVDEERWRAFRVDLEEIAFYCPSCAEREFGSG